MFENQQQKESAPTARAHRVEFDHVLVTADFVAAVAAVRALLHAAPTHRSRQPWLPGFAATLLGPA